MFNSSRQLRVGLLRLERSGRPPESVRSAARDIWARLQSRDVRMRETFLEIAGHHLPSHIRRSGGGVAPTATGGANPTAPAAAPSQASIPAVPPAPAATTAAASSASPARCLDLIRLLEIAKRVPGFSSPACDHALHGDAIEFFFSTVTAVGRLLFHIDLIPRDLPDRDYLDRFAAAYSSWAVQQAADAEGAQ